MSNRVTNAVKHWKGSPSQKAVLMCLADMANDQGIWITSNAHIQRWTCLSRTAVTDAVKVLVREGVLSVRPRAGYSHKFRVNFHDLAPPDPEEFWTLEGGPLRPPDTPPSNMEVSPARHPAPYPAGSRTPPYRPANGSHPPAGPDTSIPHNTSETHQGREKLRTSASLAKNRSASKGVSGFPENFTLDERGIQYADELKLDVKEELRKFANHYQSHGAQRSDWQATWRSWCDKCAQFGQRKSTPDNATQQTMSFRERDQLNRLLRRLQLPWGYVLWSELSRSQRVEVRSMLEQGEIENGRIVDEAPPYDFGPRRLSTDVPLQIVGCDPDSS